MPLDEPVLPAGELTLSWVCYPQLLVIVPHIGHTLAMSECYKSQIASKLDRFLSVKVSMK